MDDIIREGDFVKIVEPEMFVRCGYPIDPKELAEKLMEEEKDTIIQAMELMGCKPRPLHPSLTLMSDHAFKNTFEKVARAVAYCRAKQDHFGGRERRIHTKREEKWKGEVLKVCGIKIHKSGDYYSPSYHPGDWTGGPEWEPGGLTNMKTHKILGLRRPNHLYGFSGDDEFECRIESIHVQKLEREPEED